MVPGYCKNSIMAVLFIDFRRLVLNRISNISDWKLRTEKMGTRRCRAEMGMFTSFHILCVWRNNFVSSPLGTLLVGVRLLGYMRKAH